MEEMAQRYTERVVNAMTLAQYKSNHYSTAGSNQSSIPLKANLQREELGSDAGCAQELQ